MWIVKVLDWKGRGVTLTVEARGKVEAVAKAWKQMADPQRTVYARPA